MKAAEPSGASALVREAALDLGHLLGQHVKVAQLELKIELHAMGRRACIIAVLAALLALGYGLAIAGLAVVIGGHRGMGIPFVLIGAAHVVGAGVGLLLALTRKPGSQLMNASTTAMTRSLEALEDATASPTEKHDAS
jgi:fatty acid desaturase